MTAMNNAKISIMVDEDGFYLIVSSKRMGHAIEITQHQYIELKRFIEAEVVREAVGVA